MRRIGMRTGGPAMLLGVVLSLAGCGDEEAGQPARPSSTPTAGSTVCVSAQLSPPPAVVIDLDGDGDGERVHHVPAGGGCPAALVAEVGTDELVASLADELPVENRDLAAIRLPGRTGEVLLVTPRHPRGGFQAHLFGYADGVFEELTVDGEPIFGFVATDTNSSPLSASCVAGGFAVTEAVAHEPLGVVPAWDVFRTTYAVEGNAVTRGPREEIADNVLDDELETAYRALMRHRLFEDCRADRP